MKLHVIYQDKVKDNDVLTKMDAIKSEYGRKRVIEFLYCTISILLCISSFVAAFIFRPYYTALVLARLALPRTIILALLATVLFSILAPVAVAWIVGTVGDAFRKCGILASETPAMFERTDEYATSIANRKIIADLELFFGCSLGTVYELSEVELFAFAVWFSKQKFCITSFPWVAILRPKTECRITVKNGLCMVDVCVPQTV